MGSRVFWKVAVCLSFLISAAAFVAAPASPQQGGGRLERGKYLVEELARCSECHTPRMPDGDLDRSKWLQGAPMWFKPIQPVHDWAYAAPPLAGLPSFSDADAIKVLEKGVGPNGYPVRPPMHDYRLNHEDAAAIVAYLRSLGGK
jgi:mono/diheme cytochrome c family protein